MQEKKINKKCPPLLKGGGFNEVEDGGFLIIRKNPLSFAVSPFIKGNNMFIILSNNKEYKKIPYPNRRRFRGG